MYNSAALITFPVLHAHHWYFQNFPNRNSVCSKQGLPLSHPLPPEPHLLQRLFEEIPRLSCVHVLVWPQFLNDAMTTPGSIELNPEVPPLYACILYNK